MKKDRKKDHIDLAFEAQALQGLDGRFVYEPMTAAHPKGDEVYPVDFLGKQMQYPVWVSSMTGGTEWARTINHRLAQICRDFGFGMGLGSCRPLLDGRQHLEDFDVRERLGDELPLVANLGIAQLEEMIGKGELARISELIGLLRADGLMVHVNPLQEWMQPEGDRIAQPPVETIEKLLESADYPLLVKEVGQGFGPESMERLMELPLAAIEFGAHGGTNFSKLEMMRGDQSRATSYEGITHIGHSAEQMVNFANEIGQKLGDRCRCDHFIVSGGIRDFLDGYYLIKKLNHTGLYGQASGFLRHARESVESLRSYAQQQVEGLQYAHAYLRLTEED